MRIVNEKAYKPSAFTKVVKVEVELMLDPVPGTWHKPEDFMHWACSNSYVQSVTLVEDAAVAAVETMPLDDIAALLKASAADRKDAYRECVAWLAKHAHDHKPEALAEMMAKDLLGE